MAKKFRDSECEKQIQFKKTSSHITQSAKVPGPYKSYSVDYCLPLKNAQENLYTDIRDNAIEFFKSKQIKWHGHGWNHLLSSQTYCINLLFPFINRAEALKALLLPIFPDIDKMLPIEDDNYVTFEYNGDQNYLGEAGYGKGRGEMATYSDAAVKFQTKDNAVHLVLIEWKYTEKYTSRSKANGKSGLRRLKTYSPLFLKNDCPINLIKINNDPQKAMNALLVEPFYQLFREQLLAHEIETNDSNVQKVSVLHICPKNNVQYLQNITSPDLKGLFPGKDVTEIWKNLLKEISSFHSSSPEFLFQNFPADQFGLADWADYMHERYRIGPSGSAGEGKNEFWDFSCVIRNGGLFGSSETTFIKHVPSGWLLKHFLFKGKNFTRSSIIFFPDPNSKWQVDNLYIKWECIHKESNSNYKILMHRLKVPGGWVVKEFLTTKPSYSKEGIMNLNLTYIPDPQHSWEL